MFVFIWQGRGYLVLLAIITVFTLTALVQSTMDIQDGSIRLYVLELALSIILFLPIWFYGRKWNAERRVLVDKVTGEEVSLGIHRAFWIPIQYWAIVWPLLLTTLFFWGP